jgi:signal transduction histidine kinase
VTNRRRQNREPAKAAGPPDEPRAERNQQVQTDKSAGGPRGAVATGIKWYRRISVKLALGLGLAMFSIQFLASQLIIESYRRHIDEASQPSQVVSSPYAQYLRERLTKDENGKLVPSADAISVLETFLALSESFLWLDPNGVILAAGEKARKYVAIGDYWPHLCDSREYCKVTFDGGEVEAGSSWVQLGLDDRAVGTFVLVWFDNPIAELNQQRQAQLELFYRLFAAGLVAALTSLLMVSLVTRRLSKLAAEASAPLAEMVENVDLPGPFDASGNDEIARLAAALNTMRGRIEVLVARLADRDRQRREWIAQVSHDLRTPLTALSACLDRARERYVDKENVGERSGVYEAITVTKQDGNRLQTLVDDLFELARLDANEELMLEPVPPGELVRQTVRGLRPMAEAEGIELKAIVAPSLPTISADGRRLMRGLENMVRNAIHFGRNHVDVIVACEGDYLKFEVRDDGPGLPVKEGQVFLGHAIGQPRRPDSAGLGLIVTHRVATAHGGRLAGANLPKGASVWIEIPIVARP